MKEIKNLNSKATLANLIAGVVLLLVLVGGSLWYFSKRPSYDISVPENNLTFDESKEGVLGENKGDNGNAEKPLGTGGPDITTLPNTSSR